MERRPHLAGATAHARAGLRRRGGAAAAEGGRSRALSDAHGLMTSECCAARRRLRHLAAALLDAAVSAAPTPRGPSPFACTSCEGVLLSPVTAPCGHSFCRICAARDAGRGCRRCGTRLPTTPPRDANVLVQGLADKWWAAELKAARLRDQGNQLFARKEIAAALRKYDDALATGECTWRRRYRVNVTCCRRSAAT